MMLLEIMDVCFENHAKPMLLIASRKLRRSWFEPVSVHVEFVTEEETLGYISIRILRFYPVNIIPP